MADKKKKVNGQAMFRESLAGIPQGPLAMAPAPLAALAERVTPYLPAPTANYTISQVPSPGQGGRYRGYADGLVPPAPLTGTEQAVIQGVDKLATEGNIAGNEAGSIAGSTLGTAVGTAFGGPLGGAVGGALGGMAGDAIGGAVLGKRGSGDPFMGLAAGGRLPAPMMGYYNGRY